MFCSQCGYQLEDDAKFCSNCGRASKTPKPPAEPTPPLPPAAVHEHHPSPRQAAPENAPVPHAPPAAQPAVQTGRRPSEQKPIPLRQATPIPLQKVDPIPLQQQGPAAIPLQARDAPQVAAMTAPGPPPGMTAPDAPPARRSKWLWISLGGLAGCAAIALAIAFGASALGYELDTEFLSDHARAGDDEVAQSASRDVRREPAFRPGTALIPNSIGSASPGDTGEWSLGYDQRLVRKMFGRPTSFRVVFGADPKARGATRFERWSYPHLGASFVFRNGSFADSMDRPRKRARLRVTTPRPEQFNASLSFAQVQAMKGVAPLFQVVLPTATGEMTAFHFPDGLVAGFDHESGRLVYVEQLPESRRRNG